MPSPPPADDLRDALRRELTTRRRARDRSATTALRTALAAVDNAEAQPLDDRTDPPLDAVALGSPDLPALGATEVARRHLDAVAVRALVVAEADDLDDAARHYRSIGQLDAAATADHQAAVLRFVLGAGDSP